MTPFTLFADIGGLIPLRLGHHANRLVSSPIRQALRIDTAGRAGINAQQYFTAGPAFGTA